jgi:hypothetical protein
VQARAELEKFAAEREAMREKKQSNNRKEEQVRGGGFCFPLSVFMSLLFCIALYCIAHLCPSLPN